MGLVLFCMASDVPAGRNQNQLFSLHFMYCSVLFTPEYLRPLPFIPRSIPSILDYSCLSYTLLHDNLHLLFLPFHYVKFYTTTIPLDLIRSSQAEVFKITLFSSQPVFYPIFTLNLLHSYGITTIAVVQPFSPSYPNHPRPFLPRRSNCKPPPFQSLKHCL